MSKKARSAICEWLFAGCESAKHEAARIIIEISCRKSSEQKSAKRDLRMDVYGVRECEAGGQLDNKRLEGAISSRV